MQCVLFALTRSMVLDCVIMLLDIFIIKLLNGCLIISILLKIYQNMKIKTAWNGL